MYHSNYMIACCMISVVHNSKCESLFYSTFFFVVLNPTIQLLILSITYGTELHGIKVYYTNYDERKI